MMNTQDGSMWMGGGLMWLFWILLIIAAIWLIKFITANGSETESPLTLLEKRYARGEINEEEYLHMKQQLQSRGN